MSDTEFTRLKDLLSVRPSLKAVVESAGNPCPKSIKILLRQLSGNDPTCGIIQIAGASVRETFDVIQDIANGNFNRVQSNIELLKKYAPLLVEFVLSKEIPE